MFKRKIVKKIIKRLLEAEKHKKYIVMISHLDNELRLNHTYFIEDLSKADAMKSLEQHKKMIETNHK